MRYLLRMEMFPYVRTFQALVFTFHMKQSDSDYYTFHIKQSDSDYYHINHRRSWKWCHETYTFLSGWNIIMLKSYLKNMQPKILHSVAAGNKRSVHLWLLPLFWTQHNRVKIQGYRAHLFSCSTYLEQEDTRCPSCSHDFLLQWWWKRFYKTRYPRSVGYPLPWPQILKEPMLLCW